MAHKCHSNFNLLTAISICSGQFQFAHGNFNLFREISICSRQFQFTHGNFNLLTAISIYSGRFQFFHGNAHGIFRFSHHLSATAADSGHAPKVKTQNPKWTFKVDHSKRKMKITNQKSIYDLAELGGIYMRLGRTQTGMSSYRSPYISFHVFTELKMNSDRSDFIPVADPTRVTFVPV